MGTGIFLGILITYRLIPSVAVQNSDKNFVSKTSVLSLKSMLYTLFLIFYTKNSS